MKIALLGYGKMGRKIQEIAQSRGHKVVLNINSQNSDILTDTDTRHIDVAFEFSSPSAAFDHLQFSLNNSIPTVCGSTGWLDNLSAIHNLVSKNNTSFIYASNFSLAVNALFAVNQRLAELLSSNIDFNINIEEIHHVSKKDQPSGTAISLANQIVKNSHNRYDGWEIDAKKDQKIPITSKRQPNVPGTHIIQYQSKNDLLELKHIALNRHSFALGAVLAAEYIHDKKGIYTMNDVLKL